jgi:hypothetical protein
MPFGAHISNQSEARTYIHVTQMWLDLTAANIIRRNKLSAFEACPELRAAPTMSLTRHANNRILHVHKYTSNMEPPYHRPTASQGNSYTKPTRTQILPPEDQTERSHGHARGLSKKLHAHSIRSKARDHGHKSHRSVRHAAKDTVQSAIDIRPPVTFDSLLRRGERRSPDSSRRGSANPQNPEWEFAQQQAKAERKRVTPEDVLRLRSDNEKRERELLVALKKVEHLGMQSTRQLDDTYYSILEKAESMRNTLAEMQRLADESRSSKEKFDQDARELTKRTEKTMYGFGEFKAQEEAIDGYVSRLAESKMKTEKLNERLEASRKRVEAYEKRYRETRAKARQRWNITWGSLAAALVLLLALVVARHYRHVGYQSNGGRGVVVVGDAVDMLVGPVTQNLMATPSEDPLLEKIFENVI